MRDDRDALSQVVAFIVAGVIFVAAMGALLLTTRQGTQPEALSDPQEAAALRGRAESLASLLVESPGFTSTGQDWGAVGSEWASQSPAADDVTRLGLLDATQGGLDFNKFENLRRAPFDAALDGYVNYEEAAGTLGVREAGLDFHIRAYPSLRQVRDVLETGYKDPNLRVTYIGDIDVSKSQGDPPPSDPTEGLAVGTPTCAVSPLTVAPHPQMYRISVPVTNGGTTTTQFSALVEYELHGSQGLSQNANGFLVAPGATTTLSVDVPAVLGTDCNPGSILRFSIQDPATATVQGSTVLTSATMAVGASLAPAPLWLDTTKPYFVNPTGALSGCSDRVRLVYDGPARNMWVHLAVRDAEGDTAFAASQKVPASQAQRTFDAGCLPAGEYVATLYYCALLSCTGGVTLEQVRENVLVTTAAVDAYNPPNQAPPSGPNVYTTKEAALAEVAFLDTLVGMFCPTYFDGAASAAPYAVDWAQRCAAFKGGGPAAGDVLPDAKDIMNNDLAARLLNPDGTPRYDLTNVLVAGSNVDQTAMTSAAAKHAVRDWVLGGGMLMVFGSGDQNVNWLEPLFHAAIRSSSGGVGVPDPGHPVLHVADALDYPAYSDHGQVWNFNGQTAEHASTLFTNVVTLGGDPVMTVSNPGAIGNGSVSLTTWRAYDVYDGGNGQLSQAEGLKLVNNLLMQGYRDLFLDYGPPLPGSTNIVPAVRTVQIAHPQFVEDLELTVLVYVFPRT